MEKKKNKILVVDDEVEVTSFLGDLLIQEGYEVIVFNDAEEGLLKIKKETFDLAVLDIRMPKVSGIELLKAIKENDDNAIVIMITGYASIEESVNALRQGAYDYIFKPFNVDEILSRINNGLEKRRLIQENIKLVGDLKTANKELEKNQEILQQEVYITNRELEKRNIELQQRILELYALYQIGQALSSTIHLKGLFSNAMRVIKEALGLDDFCIILLDETDKQLKIVSSYGPMEGINGDVSYKVGEDLPGKVVQTGKLLLINDVSIVPGFGYFGGKRQDIKSLCIIPLKIGEKVIGVFSVHKDVVNGFTDRQKETFGIIAIQLATSIENAFLHQRTVELAITDELTGAFNRRYGIEQLKKEIERSKRYLHPFSLIMLDIDDFKSFNDQYGHLAGDTLLQIASSIMKGELRRTDVVMRYGGEEFLLLLPETFKDKAFIAAERIRKAIQTSEILIETLRTKVSSKTVSLGIAEYPTDALSVEDLIDKSDKALYKSKRSGKNMTCLYEKNNVE